MIKTILAGDNLTYFLQKVSAQEVKKMEQIALLSDDFIPTLETLIANNYKVDLVSINDTTIIADKPLHIINIKLK